MNQWFGEHLLITYLIIFALVTFVYNKVFRMKRMPILKESIVLLLIAIGSVMILFFQVAVELPMIPSLTIAVALMFIVRVRKFMEERGKTTKEQ